MSAKTSADVLIGGKIYTLSGYESEDYLQKVAKYINGKMNEFDEMEQFRRFPAEMKATLVELNIADDYFKAREQAEKLDQDVKEKEREIYELKHELISLRIKAESSEKTAAELEKENRKLLLHKSKLENALEDALLGKVKGQVQPISHEPNAGIHSGQDKSQAQPANHNSDHSNSQVKPVNHEPNNGNRPGQEKSQAQPVNHNSDNSSRQGLGNSQMQPANG